MANPKNVTLKLDEHIKLIFEHLQLLENTEVDHDFIKIEINACLCHF